MASVSNGGVVTAVGEGSATITAESKPLLWGARPVTTTFAVTVCAEKEGSVLTVRAGDTLTLEATVQNRKTVWRSADPAVATVSDDGVVTAVSEGRTNITARTQTRRYFWFFYWGRPVITTQVFHVEVVPAAEAFWKVTFVTGEGSAVAEQAVKAGLTVQKPADPVRSGYTFGGWYADAALTVPYDFAAPVAADLTLYAKWKLEMPANPTPTDEYYWNNSKEVVDVVNAAQSQDVITEADAAALFTARGFDSELAVYEYSIQGEYLDENGVVAEAGEKRPVYYTYYTADNGALWTVYIINGRLMAYPASLVYEARMEAEVLVSESREITSYDNESNQFYVTIPKDSAVIVKVVDKIDAATLNVFTLEEAARQ